MKKRILFLTITFSIISIFAFAQKTGTFTDTRDGKVYKTVTIGTQTWLAENFAFKADSGCWAYNNDPANIKKYGYLYNWYTAKKVCPKGWHLPTLAEWETLVNYLGGDSVAGGKLKSTTPDWKAPNKGATNSSGFTGLPAGSRGRENKFTSINLNSNFWTDTELGYPNAKYGFLSYLLTKAGSYHAYKTNACSVRYVKDK